MRHFWDILKHCESLEGAARKAQKYVNHNSMYVSTTTSSTAERVSFLNYRVLESLYGFAYYCRKKSLFEPIYFMNVVGQSCKNLFL